MSDDDYEHTTEVPTDFLRQAIACLSHDAKMAYRNNATTYADIRHATGRRLAKQTDMEWTEYPEAGTHVPDDLFDGLPERE